jgi:hypothetical protein
MIRKHGEETSRNRELQAVIMLVGSVRLERLKTRERVDRSRDLLEQEIFRRFMANPVSPLSVLISRNPPVLCTSDYLLFICPKK